MLENTKTAYAVSLATQHTPMKKAFRIALFVYSFYQSCPQIIRKRGDYIEQSAK